MNDMGAAKKRKAPVQHGDVKLQILELLTDKSMSIDQICEAKGWERHVADYALTVLRKKLKLVRDDRHEMIPKADGKGHLKVMMLEAKPNALATYKALSAGADAAEIVPVGAAEVVTVEAIPSARVELVRTAAPAVEPGNVQVEVDPYEQRMLRQAQKDEIDEYERLVFQKAHLEVRLEALRNRLFRTR